MAQQSELAREAHHAQVTLELVRRRIRKSREVDTDAAKLAFLELAASHFERLDELLCAGYARPYEWGSHIEMVSHQHGQ